MSNTVQQEIELIREAKREATEIVMKHIMLEITNAKTKSHLTLMELGAIYRDLEAKHKDIQSV